MKILYFNAFLCQNGVKTNYSLENLLSFIMNGQPLQRTQALESEKVIFLSKKREAITQRERATGRSVPGYEFINSNRTIWIGKFNDDKPYTGAIGSDDLEQIVGELYQPNTCISIPDNFLFLMEYNFLGPSRNQIEEFLSSYIVSNDDNVKYEIKIEPLLKDPMLALIPNSDSIKSVTLTLNNEGFNLGNLFSEMTDAQENLYDRLFGGPVCVADGMDVNQTTIVLRKGRKNKEMNIDEIGNILNLININSTELISAVVEFINPQTGETEKFNLKHDGYYTSSINSEGNTGFDFLAELLTTHYYDIKRRNKDNYYTRYELIEANEDGFALLYPENNFLLEEE